MPFTVKKTFEAARDTGSSLIAQVKDNQPGLMAACETLCATTKPKSSDATVEQKRRNREEHRLVEVFPLDDAAKKRLTSDWGDHIAAIVRVRRKVWRKDTKAKDGLYSLSEETAYYACQAEYDAAFAGMAIRHHWHIENKLHHVRDVTLGEDESRIRQKPTLFGRLRSFVTNIFQANHVTNSRQELHKNAFNPQRIMNYPIA